jgi:hypothetical protein
VGSAFFSTASTSGVDGTSQSTLFVHPDYVRIAFPPSPASHIGTPHTQCPLTTCCNCNSPACRTSASYSWRTCRRTGSGTSHSQRVPSRARWVQADLVFREATLQRRHPRTYGMPDRMSLIRCSSIVRRLRTRICPRGQGKRQRCRSARGLPVRSWYAGCGVNAGLDGSAAELEQGRHRGGRRGRCRGRE